MLRLRRCCWIIIFGVYAVDVFVVGGRNVELLRDDDDAPAAAVVDDYELQRMHLHQCLEDLLVAVVTGPSFVLPLRPFQIYSWEHSVISSA